jgi:methylthioribose-1-phosphate isomerase
MINQTIYINRTLTLLIQDHIRPIIWSGDHLRLLDQRLLPGRAEYIDYTNARDVAGAITTMVVRGAPAIGITAAYGVVLAARAAYASDPVRWRDVMQADLQTLAQSRPTAVNLRWALERMQLLCAGIKGVPEQVLLKEAQAIHAEDIAANRHMGALGATLIANARAVLTHCNTGSLATGGFGTALGVIRTAFQEGILNMVYVDETRPWLQGARLTAWELQQDGIPVTLLADSAASYLLSRGEVQWVIVGADRIAANGDVANKIGTYGLAVAARHHGVKFMVVAPTSTFDPNTSSGKAIPIEDRGPSEVTHFAGRQTAPTGVSAWNPVFDITPAGLVDVIVTEKGVIAQPDADKVAALLRSS